MKSALTFKISTILCALVVMTASGCKHRVLKSGSSEVEFIKPRGGSEGKASISEKSDEIRAWVNHIDPSVKAPVRKPVYPKSVLLAGGEQHTVYATVFIDESGKVSDVRQSWTNISTPSRYSDDFFNAVRNAIEEWKFEPAYDVYWQKVDGEDKYVKTQAVSSKFEVKFTFDVTGTVR